MTEFKEQQLLFCVEQESLVGMLHFVTFDTLESEEPELCACMAPKNWLRDFEPGGLYRLEIKNGSVVQYIKERAFMITQPYFTMLLERKHVYYDRNDAVFVPQQYYTFSDYRTLLLYRPTRSQRWLTLLSRALLNLLAILLPMGLLALLGVNSWRNGASVSTPMLVLAALPLTIWAMTALAALVRQVMLRWPYARYQSLQEDCLRSGGKRSPITMPKGERNKLLLFGLPCLVVFVLAWLLLR